MTKTSLETIIEEIIENKINNMKESDIKELVRELMPDIDRMIAKKVKEHFYQMGNFLVEKFKEKESGE